MRRATDLPLIAAGGIATGEAMLATMILGADGVQMGSRFVASEESSGHQLLKDLVVAAGEGATELTLKELTPVRLLKKQILSRFAGTLSVWSVNRGVARPFRAGPREARDV